MQFPIFHIRALAFEQFYPFESIDGLFADDMAFISSFT